jgi:hypothetical protein
MTADYTVEAQPSKTGHGGRRPGAGRKPQLLGLLTRGRILGLLDEAGPRIVERLIELCESENEAVAVRASIALFAKLMPDDLHHAREWFREHHYLSTDEDKAAHKAEHLAFENETGGFMGIGTKE